MPALPNGDQAIVESEKLTGYVLNPAHRTGRNKARVFASALGISAATADVLRDALLDAARTADATRERADQHGVHFAVEFVLEVSGRRARVRSLWVVRTGEGFPRLVSAFVKDRSNE